jgi:hypothetical protein
MQQAYKFDARVGVSGRVELTVPVPEGTEIEVVVLTPADGDCSDLIEAAQTSLEFWDNPQDDADWNHA